MICDDIFILADLLHQKSSTADANFDPSAFEPENIPVHSAV